VIISRVLTGTSIFLFYSEKASSGPDDKQPTGDAG